MDAFVNRNQLQAAAGIEKDDGRRSVSQGSVGACAVDP